jgi:hypothetical protein
VILDPINSITSLNFYRKVAAQSLGRTFLYLFYLAALFALVGTAAAKLRLDPAINETFDWLEKSVPTLTFSGGKLSSALTAPLTLRHPSVKDVAFTIDTTRTDPVTPQMMEDSQVIAYLTANALYLRQQNGRLDVYDLSKTPVLKPVVIDADFYREARTYLTRFLYPLALAFIFFAFAAWKACATLGYSLVALAVNSATGAGLEYGRLYSVSLYAQTLAAVVQAISLFTPAGIPFFPVLAAGLTSLYIGLAVKRIAQPAVPRPEAA